MTIKIGLFVYSGVRVLKWCQCIRPSRPRTDTARTEVNQTIFTLHLLRDLFTSGKSFGERVLLHCTHQTRKVPSVQYETGRSRHPSLCRCRTGPEDPGRRSSLSSRPRDYRNLFSGCDERGYPHCSYTGRSEGAAWGVRDN